MGVLSGAGRVVRLAWRLWAIALDDSIVGRIGGIVVKSKSSLIGVSCGILLSVFTTQLMGCAAGGASELAIKPVAKPLRLDGAIRVPGDHPFSVLSSPSQENPAPGGRAEAQAEAKPTGESKANAVVENGGTASASFQLGSAFVNESDQQIDVSISAKYHYDYALQTSAKSRSGDATLSLHFYARDQYNRLLRDIPLLTQSTDQGAAGQSGESTLNLTLTIGPRDSLYVFFGGAVGVDTLKSSRSANAELRLSGVELSLNGKAAPPVKAAAP